MQGIKKTQGSFLFICSQIYLINCWKLRKTVKIPLGI